MSYRLFVTDLDGTLLTRSGAIRAEDRSAIAELRRRDVAVSIVTGRLYSGTRDIARGLGVLGPIGCVDGSHIVEVAGDRDLLLRPIPDAGARLLRQWLLAFRLATFLMAGDSILHDGSGTRYLQYLTLWTRRVRAVDDVLDAGHFTGNSPPVAVVALGDRDQIGGIRARIQAGAGQHLQAASFSLRPAGLRGLWGLVTRAAGPSKATAVEWIARYHGASRDETVAVGDWWNDIPMLRAAGRSFAMGQAPAEVREAATDQLQATVLGGGGIAEAAARAGLL